MSSPSVSIVVPAYNEQQVIRRTLVEILDYLDATGLAYEVLVVDDGSDDETCPIVRSIAETRKALRLVCLEENRGKGAAVRRGVAEAAGEVIAFNDADLPYRVQNLGDAITLVQSGATAIAIGSRALAASEFDPSYPWIRRFMGRSFSLVVRGLLVRGIADTQCGLKAFSRPAAKQLFAESRLDGFGFDFEVLFLARRFGYSIKRIPVAMSHRHESKVRLVRDSLGMLSDVLRVRWWDLRGGYREPKRCPVCLSTEVWTRTQIREFVVRECNRCRCRYLNVFPSNEDLEAMYDSDYFESSHDTRMGYAARETSEANRRTNESRLTAVRRRLPSRSRILEIGAGTGLFGDLAATEYEYCGIDLSDKGARAARERGLDVYRAGLSDFVNPGHPFDGVTAFHVFEHLPDPHQALARIHDLLKPGGYLFLITPDTESVLCAISGDNWVSYKFPEHLILYSRTALIELLEQAGFEILSAGGDSEHCEHEFLRARLRQLGSLWASVAIPLLRVLPDPLAVTSGSIRVVARRRVGPPVNLRPIRAVEPTHAR